MRQRNGYICKRCGTRFRGLYGTQYCSQACAMAGVVLVCRCEWPAPNGEDGCFKCGRDLRVAA